MTNHGRRPQVGCARETRLGARSAVGGKIKFRTAGLERRRMIAAPQRSNSPFLHCPSPLSFSLVLAEHRAAVQNQTVPISPSLSPLAPQTRQRSNSAQSLSAVSGPNRTLTNRHSPSPALVPEYSERISSGSPLLRHILTGRLVDRPS